MNPWPSALYLFSSRFFEKTERAGKHGFNAEAQGLELGKTFLSASDLVIERKSIDEAVGKPRKVCKFSF